MVSGALPVWLARRTSRSPLAWCALASIAGLPALATALGPFGARPSPPRALEIGYEVAFVGILAGVTFGVGAATELRRLLPTLDRARRFVSDVKVLTLCTLATGIVASVAASEPRVDFVRATLVAAHGIALALLVLRLPFVDDARPLLCVLLAWIVPALFPDHTAFGRGFHFLLDAHRAESLETEWTGVLTAVASIFSLSLLSIAADFGWRGHA